ncbi:hypothetical protein [Massilia sp. H6]|uniref:hypothetical protein n=1 Tax=Massilia sp. H6 TaxID=2970464 RepID=UPI0021697A0E|nr:hypothetical protein [Massilia sp. H6]UVW27937.1 hypothetical protein NRS07_15495 [Massilia sp. H6]
MTVHTDAQLTSGPLPPQKTTVEQLGIARFHASGLLAQLALSRWQHGGDSPHLHPGVPALRAAHYHSAQSDFLAWLESGGLHAAETAPGRSAPASLSASAK